jgi:hypothetical protein
MEMDGLLRTLAECEKRGLDLAPPMRQFGREMKKEVTEAVASGKGFPPLATATLERYARAEGGDTKFTLKGDLRKGYQAKLDREKTRLEGLKKWAENRYRFSARSLLLGKKLPTRVQQRIDKFEALVQRLEAQSQKRKDFSISQAGQVGARHILDGGPSVELRVTNDKKRRRVHVVTPGYRQDLHVAFPTHLRKAGATYHVPASALTMTPGGYYRVKPTAIVRGERGGDSGGGASAASRKPLGKVPSTLYYKVIRNGRHFLLAWGSRWRKDGIHNAGDAHTPKREHVVLKSEHVARLTQILVSYGVQPLKGTG